MKSPFNNHSVLLLMEGRNGECKFRLWNQFFPINIRTKCAKSNTPGIRIRDKTFKKPCQIEQTCLIDCFLILKNCFGFSGYKFWNLWYFDQRRKLSIGRRSWDFLILTSKKSASQYFIACYWLLFSYYGIKPTTFW